MASQGIFIANLKRQAKRIAREQGCPHHIALNHAAVERGFQNFTDALRTSRDQERLGTPTYSLILQQWWRNSKTRENGVASVTMPLAQPIEVLVKSHQLAGYLSGCRVTGDGMITLPTGGYLEDDHDHAHRRVNRIARTLQFMERTGLRPSMSNRCYPRSDWYNRPPIADHDKCWYHPFTKQFVLSTEPYPGRADQKRLQMTEWCGKYGFEYVLIEGQSMYGYGTQLFLVSKAGSPANIHRMAADLAVAPLAFADS